jgi:hypothetical protein
MNVKELREPLYDTYSVAAAASPAALPNKIQFFVTGKSSSKGIEKTNMNDDGKMPSPERISIYAAPRLVFIGMIDADVLAIVKSYAVRLTVNGSPLGTYPIEFCAAGGGPNTQNGANTIEAVPVLAEEFRIDIESGEKFMLELVTEGTPPTPTATGASTPGTGVFIRAMLDGVHRLPVG